MKLWPTRSKAKQDHQPVADLDAIVNDPVYFRYKGKIHTLKPMSLEQFLRFSNAQSRLMDGLKDDVKLTAKELAERYLSVISSVCDTILLDDILEMEQVQVAALYQLVIDLVTGQVGSTGDVKKKRERIDIYPSAQVSSSPSAASVSGGAYEKP